MKSELRSRLLRERNRLDRELRERWSRAIQDSCLSLPEYRRSRAVFLYADMGREVMTGGILEQALADGKTVCMPANDFLTRRFTVSRIRSARDIDRRGRIPEPLAVEPVPAGDIDLVVVPGVVFDRTGNRIGMGGGFYDRFFEEAAGAARVALAFGFQVLDEALPSSAHDEPVDVIVTEREVIRTGRRSMGDG